MQFPLALRGSELRVWRVAVGLCIALAMLVSGLALCAYLQTPVSWALRRGMKPDQVRRIMGEPDVAFGQDHKLEWRYVHVELLSVRFRDGVLDHVWQQGKGEHPANDDRLVTNERTCDSH
jgi:beta-galactosidase GanA